MFKSIIQKQKQNTKNEKIKNKKQNKRAQKSKPFIDIL